jgi:hypothetical protein
VLGGGWTNRQKDTGGRACRLRAVRCGAASAWTSWALAMMSRLLRAEEWQGQDVAHFQFKQQRLVAGELPRSAYQRIAGHAKIYYYNGKK